MAFNIGDVVKLKSGGAPMTVTSICGENGKHHLVWHNQVGSNFEERTAYYHADTLIAADQQGRMTINFVKPGDD